MLTYEQLEQYYTKRGTGIVSQKSMLVEYLQYELLDSLFKQEGSEHLSFMGGTSVRIGYGGSRFSEDLDFDNFGLSFVEFQELLGGAMKDMGTKGFAVELRFAEKGAYHCYVKFPDILQKENLSSHADEKILVRIDAMKKEKIFQPRVFTINMFDIYREILLNPADIILAQKIIAVLGRKREQGRDFFDITFLYGLTGPNWQYIEKSAGMNREEFQARILEKCEKLDFEILAKDVEPFLEKPEQRMRVEKFPQFIAQVFASQGR